MNVVGLANLANQNASQNAGLSVSLASQNADPNAKHATDATIIMPLIAQAISSKKEKNVAVIALLVKRKNLRNVKSVATLAGSKILKNKKLKKKKERVITQGKCMKKLFTL